MTLLDKITEPLWNDPRPLDPHEIVNGWSNVQLLMAISEALGNVLPE